MRFRSYLYPCGDAGTHHIALYVGSLVAIAPLALVVEIDLLNNIFRRNLKRQQPLENFEAIKEEAIANGERSKSSLWNWRNRWVFAMPLARAKGVLRVRSLKPN
ncbi:MAG: hypothetical protein J7642_21260 [Cyanobacteria bacterium SBC]|nr:hypothetical protein [Cyanobacteria bacterium SBC]